MALSAGSVSISSSDATVNGTGLSLAIYNAFKQDLWDDRTKLTIEQSVGAKNSVADLSNKLATAIISHFTANAEISVSTAAAGLQTLPATLTPGTPTAAPQQAQPLNGTLR